MLAHRPRFRASIRPTLFRRLVFAGIPVYMGHCMGYSVATLPQQIPANTGHWPNAVEDVGPALYKCCTGVLYLLGLQQQYMRSR